MKEERKKERKKECMSREIQGRKKERKNVYTEKAPSCEGALNINYYARSVNQPVNEPQHLQYLAVCLYHLPSLV